MQLPIAEAAARLGISIDTARRHLKAGKLSGSKDDAGRWLVDVDDPVEIVAADGLADPRDLVIEVLREQLEARTREVSELHVLLAQRAPDRRPFWRRLLGPPPPAE